MRTIQGRFTLLIMAAIFASVTIIGITATATAVQKTDADAVQIVNLTCQNEALSIDSALGALETAVDTGASYAQSILESPEKLFSDKAYRSEYVADVQRAFSSIADDTDGAISYYYRLNAEAAGPTEGFLYARGGVGEPFASAPPTDISQYDPSDDEHVGWYYIPLRYEQPAWIDPYQNQNLGIYMISYVAPLYVNDVFIGVLGMDINFQVVIDQLSTVHPLNNGYAFLCNKDAKIMSSPLLTYGTSFDEAGAVGQAMFQDILAASSNGEELVEYTLNGVDKKMAFQTLRNGLVLATVANTADINASRNELVLNIAVTALIVLAVFIVFALLLGRRMLKPLNELTETAHEVADGNLDVKLPEARSDEITTLIEAYRVTVDRMRRQMEYIEELAHHDALTHLWNKTAYDERVEQLEQAIQDEDAHFAIVMVDVNDLKFMNDEFGHDRGDEYLLHASNLLCKTFGEEHIYRIGGDEFVAVVQDDDLATLEESLGKLDAAMSQSNDVRNLQAEDEPWKTVSLAYGCVRYDSAKHADVIQVFQQADAAMYVMKRAMKSVS